MPDSDFLFGPTPHQEAIDFIKSKPVVAREVFDGLLPELKARAFTVTGLEGQANVMERIRDRIAELPAGADWAKAKKDIAGDISVFLVDPNADAKERAAQEASADARAELLLKTHGFQAYQAAQFQVMNRQKDVMPYWQYQTMEDAYVRPTHAALDKIVLPANSPFWADHFPPWDYGCRCQAIPLSLFDHADLVKADQDRSSDDKLVLQGPQLTHLEQGTLVRSGRTYDVRSPVQKEGGSGFSWDPSTLRLPLDQLRKRYADQPDTWNEFEAWAKKTPLGPHQPTVWEWLQGKPAGPVPPKPVAPAPRPKDVIPPPPHAPPHLPPPLPRPTLDEFVAQHTALPGKMTEQEARNFIAALKQPHGVTVAEKATVVVTPGLSAEWHPFVEDVMQDFLDVIPKPLLDTLPRFKVKVSTSMSGGTLGEYDMIRHMLQLNAKALAGNAARIREVTYHEMAHWMHLHGPAEYAAAIEEHFNLRTAGEPIGQLPNYGHGSIGKKDKFWDTYMGRLYTGIVDGCEIPTKVFELLTNPSMLSLYWNIPLHRETIKKALSVLFP